MAEEDLLYTLCS